MGKRHQAADLPQSHRKSNGNGACAPTPYFLCMNSSAQSPTDPKLESWRSGSLRGATAKGGAARPRVLFGSVFEDADVELCAWQMRLTELENSEREPRAFCIASGGDTLFSLLLPGVGRVDGVDINPAQIWLCELKVAARRTLSPQEFARATAFDARPVYSRLRAQLSREAEQFWDDNLDSLRNGLNGCGFVDGVLRHASRGLRWLIGRRAVRALLRAQSAQQQREIWQNLANRKRFGALFSLALHPLILRAFYGKALRARLPLDLGKRVRHNIEHTLLELPIERNPYLISLLRGRLARDENNWPIALRPDSFGPIQSRLDNLTLNCADATNWLNAQAEGSIDFFGLSNVVEAIEASSAEKLLRAVARAAAPDALICVRTITGVAALPIAGLSVDARTNELKAMDRSPFCRLSELLIRSK